MGLVSAMVLVLSVLKVLVATVEGSSLISVPSKRSRHSLFKGLLGQLVLMAFANGQKSRSFLPTGLPLGCSPRMTKAAEFPSGGTNTLPQWNLRQVLVESCMVLISLLSPSSSLALVLLQTHSGPAEMVCLMLRELQLSVYQDLSTQ